MHKTKHKERNLVAGCFFVDHLASGKIRKEKKGNIINEGNHTSSQGSTLIGQNF